MRQQSQRVGHEARACSLGAALFAAALAFFPQTAHADATASLNQALLTEEISLQFYSQNANQSFLTATGGTAGANSDLSALNSMLQEIRTGHQAHLTMLQQMLGANAQAMPALRNLNAGALPQFLTMAQSLEDIDVNLHQGVIESGLQSGSLNPLGGTTAGTASSTGGVYGLEVAILADDARYDGALRAFERVIPTAEGGNPNGTLMQTGTPLSPGFTSAQATEALQSYLAASSPATTPPAGGVTTQPSAPAVSFSKDILRIFTNNGTKTCAQAGCHGGANPQLGQNLAAASAYASIVNVPSVEKPSLMRVKPGDAADSYLYQKITGAPGITGSRMPLIGGPLAGSDITLIQQWINAGAPNN
jgi:hypothetical protein